MGITFVSLGSLGEAEYYLHFMAANGVLSEQETTPLQQVVVTGGRQRGHAIQDENGVYQVGPLTDAVSFDEPSEL